MSRKLRGNVDTSFSSGKIVFWCPPRCNPPRVGCTHVGHLRKIAVRIGPRLNHRSSLPAQTYNTKGPSLFMCCYTYECMVALCSRTRTKQTSGSRISLRTQKSNTGKGLRRRSIVRNPFSSLLFATRHQRFLSRTLET
jgi:hypothetical protein